MTRLALRALGAVAAAVLSASAAAIDSDPMYLEPKYGEGCWVQFFEQPNFREPLGLIGRSTYINSLAAPGLIGNLQIPEFFRRASSLVVGPEARVLVYAEPAFREELLALEPGRKVADLHALGFPERAASLKIVCPEP